jgi:hypothetical protein
MQYKYGDFSHEQIVDTKERMRKQIFFLLLIVDPKTASEYENIDVLAAFDSTLSLFGSLNDLLGYPKEFVRVMSLLNMAYLEYQSEKFSWSKYRKAILDAGSAVLNIKEV